MTPETLDRAEDEERTANSGIIQSVVTAGQIIEAQGYVEGI